MPVGPFVCAFETLGTATRRAATPAIANHDFLKFRTSYVLPIDIYAMRQVPSAGMRHKSPLHDQTQNHTVWHQLYLIYFVFCILLLPCAAIAMSMSYRLRRVEVDSEPDWLLNSLKSSAEVHV
jgi:hypothetical protein